MHIKELLHFDQVELQTIKDTWLDKGGITLDILRFDKLHEVVSGNKWFKLQFYIEEALRQDNPVIATFGGAYSNHIVATAFVCGVSGLRCIGVIRGERPACLSHTLLEAESYGMELIFKSRNDYKNKDATKNEHPEYFWINEGGYGQIGSVGARQMLSFAPDLPKYTHIVGAVGSGTMLAGLADAALEHQEIIGVNVMKGNEPLIDQVMTLVEDKSKNIKMNNDFHFGGYAKYTNELIGFMNECWDKYQLPLDFVYSAKSFFATKKLIESGNIPPGSKVLYIHCGGLQGNLSLPQGALLY